MKNTIAALILAVLLPLEFSLHAGLANGVGGALPNPLNHPVSIANVVVESPLDPYRTVKGVTWTLTGVDERTGWVEFSGKVLEVQPQGIRVQGGYSGYGCMTCGDNYEYTREFFVANFPYEVAEGDLVNGGYPHFYCAKESGTYTYNTVTGGSRTIHQLDYGTIYVPPPPTPEQIAQAKTNAIRARIKLDAARQAAADKALKYNQDLAAKGDAYGLLRMGERYRDGDGVAKDLPTARDYFSKAIAAGSLDASNELAALTVSAAKP